MLSVDSTKPFRHLQQFGGTFLSRFESSQSNSEALKSVTLLDTPGILAGEKQLVNRGYDFSGVLKWFAERADVILLFFDPDKPGTTGETLSILVNSLGGMDHKLYIVLNKADQFKKMHDFARAYGSLCWNLSKVIPRKDLPKIYTMCF